MKNSILGAAGALALCAALVLPAVGNAADFQVAVKRLSVTQCSMTGSLLNIDPVTGNVSIDLTNDLACYPPVVTSLANAASISVTGPTTVGGGQTGQGDVTLQLNTGLSGVTVGVSCYPDGVIVNSGSVNVISGWTASAALCTNCGSAASRTVTVQNPSTTTNGTITFKAKCTYQDQANANLQSVRTNIQSTPTVTVQPGTAPPPPNYCASVTSLATPNGLTDADRQLTGTVTGGTMPGSSIDFTNYTSVFGVSPNTYPVGSNDTVGFGFPGTNRTNVQIGLQRGKYVSWRFRAPTSINWDNVQGSFQIIPGAAFTLAAIAPCPGQFSTDANYPINASCSVSGKSSDLVWKITNGAFAGCKLVPGTTYHFSIIQAASTSQLTTPTCASSLCSPKINLSGAIENP
jgi:hypothetical protein